VKLANWHSNCANPPPTDANICANTANDELWDLFGRILTSFDNEGPTFQMAGHEMALLPLYAQYMNLFVPFLSDGVMLHDQYWSHISGKDTNDDAAKKMAEILDPTYKAKGVGYVNQMYNCGAPFDSANPTKCDGGLAGLKNSSWTTRNAYIRDKILKVLDFRDTWKYMNPRAYPGGVPGGVKLTRMIYSDPVGTVYGTPRFPSNVRGPLRETSVWTVRIDEALFTSHLYIDAVQSTNPPLLGPAASGPVSGDTSQPASHAHYYNLSAKGPIIKVQGKTMPKFVGSTWVADLPHWLRYDYANGTYDQAGDSTKDTTVLSFQYDGEVLATVESNGESYGQAASVVFGFRYADSFEAAGEAVGVASGKCLDATAWTDGSYAMIWTCANPASVPQIWTYDRVLQQISFTVPSEWSPNDPTVDGKHCLDTANNRVIINKCDDGAYNSNGMSTQRWIIDGVGATTAKITNAKSGLVIGVIGYSSADGAGLELQNYAGNAAQQWRAHDTLTGEIHSICSGRCVDVPNTSTTAGTQVQIYDCKGNAAQQWRYDPTTRALIYAYAPSLCLEGGASGTAPKINPCTGVAAQQWTLNGDGSTITNAASGLVLDVPEGGTANNTPVQMYRLNNNQSQQWSRTSSRGGVIYAVGAGKCLTVPAASWSKGTQLVVQTCASPLSAAQTWTYHPIAQTYTVNSPSGPMCLEARGSDSKAVIDDCNGLSNQRWVLDSKSLAVVTGYNSSVVLDVAGGGTADGTPVVVWTHQSGTNQQWVWSLN
jgi:hypothetical protein